LSDFVQTTLTPTDLAAELTMLGFEVESQESTLPALDGVIVARVAACESHPKSDHLKICRVDTGRDQHTVICGAPNVAPNQLVAFAGAGTVLPGGLRIDNRNILGVESHGMICSEAELGISDAADEILVLNGRVKVGEPVLNALEADTVFEINVTPNRPDCLGIIGVAREIAALTGKPLRIPKPKFREGRTGIESAVKITIKDTRACPRYAARLIENVRIGPSPGWMAKRLKAVGIRPISNVVDVTNYVMMETGQPLHAFDFANLRGRHIIVRGAQAGEQFQTLDEKTHRLQANDLLICDAERPVALAGIMGGLNSEVAPTTQNVLIECAYFEPMGVRRTAKRLGIASESARRFERGVDPNGIPYALARAAELMLEIAGGAAARGALDIYPQKIKPAAIIYRPQRAMQVIGKRLREAEMLSIFKRLQFHVIKPQKSAWRITVPTYRPDLTREIDLIEEVARLYGYDRIEPQMRANITLKNERNLVEAATERMRNVFTGLGLHEAVTLSLMAPRPAGAFLQEGTQKLTVRNPLSEELSTLRPSIVATLLSSAAYNLNRKIVDFGLFEIGSVFWRAANGEIIENRMVGAVLSGAVILQSWRDKSRPYLPADLKGLLEAFAEHMRLPLFQFVEGDNVQIFSGGWQLLINGQLAGRAGPLSAECRELYGINQELQAVELDFDALLQSIDWQYKARGTPRFPAVERDISILVDEITPAGRIDDLIKQAGGEFLESHRLFDLYSGQQVPPGKKSMTYALQFRAPDRTLREAEIDAWQSAILRRLEQEAGATLRT
jgi:phenylalanyl-tRNA synthetase beta chain